MLAGCDRECLRSKWEELAPRFAGADPWARGDGHINVIRTWRQRRAEMAIRVGPGTKDIGARNVRVYIDRGVGSLKNDLLPPGGASHAGPHNASHETHRPRRELTG